MRIVADFRESIEASIPRIAALIREHGKEFSALLTVENLLVGLAKHGKTQNVLFFRR